MSPRLVDGSKVRRRTGSSLLGRGFRWTLMARNDNKFPVCKCFHPGGVPCVIPAVFLAVVPVWLLSGTRWGEAKTFSLLGMSEKTTNVALRKPLATICSCQGGGLPTHPWWFLSNEQVQKREAVFWFVSSASAVCRFFPKRFACLPGGRRAGPFAAARSIISSCGRQHFVARAD